MAYAPTTDFIALLRQTSAGVRTARMPGLDYVVAAMARGGMFLLHVGQTEPTLNQAITVWLKPPQASSWAAESSVYLWNTSEGEYQPATNTLWAALFTAVASVGLFQAVTTGAAAVGAGTTMAGIQRAAPAATALTLPSVAVRANKALQIVDWSTGVTEHVITMTPQAGETIMRQPNWRLFSTADQLAGITLYPSTNLNGWAIAP